jgi:hypothetical protein
MEGELVIIPLQKPYYFGVAKVLSATSDGSITFQWISNATENTNGVLYPGWLRSSAPQMYYAEKRKHHTHKPFTGSDDVVITQKQLIMHGFQLTDSNRLPANVLRALQEDSRVGGE